MRTCHLKTAALALAATLALAGPVASAREIDPRAVRSAQISISFNVVVPAPAETGLAGRFSTTEAMRRAFYELVTRECELLLATIAATCQLNNASVNVSEQRHNQPAPYVQINGSGNFSVTLKPRP